MGYEHMEKEISYRILLFFNQFLQLKQDIHGAACNPAEPKTADLSVENSPNSKTHTLTLRLMLRNWQVLS